MHRPQILASAQAQFPKSANKQMRIVSACGREDSTLDHPEPSGTDGWTSVSDFATYEVVKRRRDRGFTVVNMSTGGVAWGYKDVAISALI